MSAVPFSFSYGPDATAAEIEALRSEAEARAIAHAANAKADWRLNEAERCPGPIRAVRLRDGRFLDCEDGPEALGLSWAKRGEPDDVVEYLAEKGPIE